MSGILIINDHYVRRFMAKLAELTAKIDQARTEGATYHMALSDDLNALADRVTTALTGMAADIRDLKAGLPPGPLTAAEGDALKAKLEAIALRAEGIDAETPPVV